MKLIRSQMLVGATLLAETSRAAYMSTSTPGPTVLVQAETPVVTNMAVQDVTSMIPQQTADNLSDQQLMNMMSQLNEMKAATNDGKNARAIAQTRTQQTVSSLTAAEPYTQQVITQPVPAQVDIVNATTATTLASLASAPNLEAIQVKNLDRVKLPDQKAVTPIGYQNMPQINQAEAVRQVQAALGLQEVYQTDRLDKLQAAQRDELLKNATAAIEGLIHLRAAKRLQQVTSGSSVAAPASPLASVPTEAATVATAAKVMVPVVKTTPAPVTVQLASAEPQIVAAAPVKSVPSPNLAPMTQPAEVVATNVSVGTPASVSGETSEEEKLNVLARYYQTLQGQVEQQKLALVEARKHATRLVNQAFARPAGAAKREDEPKQNKVLDFLSSLGKVASMLLAVTPLPTYLGTWGKPKKEQVERVESISFTYLLLQVLNNCIWTSYAFKTQNIDLAIISVVPLIIAIILTAIYLCVKPESPLMSQFFAMLLLCQVFNFDLLSTSVSGALGTLVSILGNLIGLSFVPEVIESRDTRGFNMPLTYINIFNLVIWFSYALLKLDPFMSLSQGLGLLFNVIQAMFYHWAKGRINAHDTPTLWVPMRALISFFNLFVVKQKLGEIQAMFWADESSLQAQFYVNSYQKDIEALEEKYADSEKSYEQHMADMQRINTKLASISSGKYDAYIQRLAAKGEISEKQRPSFEAAASSNGSTHAGSSDFVKESPRGSAQQFNNQQRNFQRPSNEFNGVYQRPWDGQAYDQHAMAYMQQHHNAPMGYPHHAHWHGPQNFGPVGDDSISMTSFNSSMNFTRLQNSINFRAGLSNQSQSTNYFRSRLQNMNAQPNYYMPHQMNVAPIQEHSTFGHHQVAERQMVQMHGYHGDESTLMLDDIAGVQATVKEACAEDEQSSRNISRGLISHAQPRTSVASIISAIEPDDSIIQHELKEMHFIQSAKDTREQRLSASIDMNNLNQSNLSNALPSLNKSTSGIMRDQREIAAQAEKAIKRNQHTLTQFFNAEEKPPQLPTEANAASVAREEDEQQRLLAIGGTGEDAQRSSEGNSSHLLNNSEYANAVSVSGMAHELQTLADSTNNSMEHIVTDAAAVSKTVNHSMTSTAQHQNSSSSGNSSSGVLAVSASFVNQTGEKDLAESTEEIPLQRMD